MSNAGSKEKFIKTLCLLIWILPSIASGTPPLPLDLDSSVKSCEERRENCYVVDLYRHTGKVSDSTAKKYLEMGCNAKDITACLSLGKYFLEKKQKSEAWLPLAKACFVNNNVACHELREAGLPIPPYLTLSSNYGPSWPSDFKEFDSHLIEHQVGFRKCYEKRKRAEGVLQVLIRPIRNHSEVDVIQTNLEPSVSACIVDEIRKIDFGKNMTSKIGRTFQYSGIYTSKR